MKITKERIEQIIREELQLVIEKGFIDTAVATVANKGIDKVKSGFKSGDRGGSNIKGFGYECDPWYKMNAITDPSYAEELVRVNMGSITTDEEDICDELFDDIMKNTSDVPGPNYGFNIKKGSDRRAIKKALRKSKISDTGKVTDAKGQQIGGDPETPLEDFKAWIAKIIA
jgi:hypothetical protein